VAESIANLYNLNYEKVTDSKNTAGVVVEIAFDNMMLDGK